MGGLQLEPVFVLRVQSQQIQSPDAVLGNSVTSLGSFLAITQSRQVLQRGQGEYRVSQNNTEPMGRLKEPWSMEA